jgi:ABC-type bacteriocin/lantibiotic exporter with double-glycine peptidase domain
MRPRLGTLLATLMLGIVLAGIGRAQDAPTISDEPASSDGFTRDAVCGPRCVQYLLRHYNGEAPELITLVRQIQWPKISAGSSLADLQRALESYGVRAKPLQVVDGSVPVLAHPCICHYRAQGESMGHFVVLLPGTTRTTAIFWDSGRTWECPSWELTERCSGSVLLTAPHSSEQPDAAVHWTTDSLLERAAYYGLGGLASVACAWLALAVRRRTFESKAGKSDALIS